MRRAPRFCLLPLLFLLLATGAQSAPEAWSASLLNNTAAKETPPETAQTQGLVLRSYQLRHLKIGEGGRVKTALSMVERLLSPGGNIRQEPSSNSLHILSSESAHAAIWELLSALDTAEVSQRGPIVPGEITEALRRLSEKAAKEEGTGSALLQLREELKSAGLQSQSESRQLRIAISTLCILFLVTLLYLLFRRLKSWRETAQPLPPAATSMSLLTDTRPSFIEPTTPALQKDMLNALSAAAQRLDAWHKEQLVQRENLESLCKSQEARFEQMRQGLINESRELLQQNCTRFENSAGRIEEGVRQLSLQNDKIASLTTELQNTLQELDGTKDQIFHLQGELEGKGQALDTARQRLNEREQELTRQQAKIAALSLILEEGAGLPELRFCTASTTAQADSSSPSTGYAPPEKPRFRFLPP